MEITLLIVQNHGKNHGIVFLNFCGNLEKGQLTHFYWVKGNHAYVVALFKVVNGVNRAVLEYL